MKVDTYTTTTTTNNIILIKKHITLNKKKCKFYQYFLTFIFRINIL